jgi:hypothetical protein
MRPIEGHWEHGKLSVEWSAFAARTPQKASSTVRAPRQQRDRYASAGANGREFTGPIDEPNHRPRFWPHTAAHVASNAMGVPRVLAFPSRPVALTSEFIISANLFCFAGGYNRRQSLAFHGSRSFCRWTCVRQVSQGMILRSAIRSKGMHGVGGIRKCRCCNSRARPPLRTTIIP